MLSGLGTPTQSTEHRDTHSCPMPTQLSRGRAQLLLLLLLLLLRRRRGGASSNTLARHNLNVLGIRESPCTTTTDHLARREHELDVAAEAPPRAARTGLAALWNLLSWNLKLGRVSRKCRQGERSRRQETFIKVVDPTNY